MLLTGRVRSVTSRKRRTPVGNKKKKGHDIKKKKKKIKTLLHITAALLTLQRRKQREGNGRAAGMLHLKYKLDKAAFYLVTSAPAAEDKNSVCLLKCKCTLLLRGWKWAFASDRQQSMPGVHWVLNDIPSLNGSPSLHCQTWNSGGHEF